MADAPGPKDFDNWRSTYCTMTDTERREWDRWCYQHWPEQAHGSLAAIKEFLGTGEGLRVVEVGGWRGDHAAACLKALPGIASWTNIEFCFEAALARKCEDPRYQAMVPDAFRWWRRKELLEGDVLILSHIIEHLSPFDLTGLLGVVFPIRRIYVEAPISNEGQNWEGYLGTHTLTWGWLEVEAAFREEGYEVESSGDQHRVFRRMAP